MVAFLVSSGKRWIPGDYFECAYVLAKTPAMARAQARRLRLGLAHTYDFADLRAERVPEMDGNKNLPIDLFKRIPQLK